MCCRRANGASPQSMSQRAVHPTAAAPALAAADWLMAAPAGCTMLRATAGRSWRSCCWRAARIRRPRMAPARRPTIWQRESCATSSVCCLAVAALCCLRVFPACCTTWHSLAALCAHAIGLPHASVAERMLHAAVGRFDAQCGRAQPDESGARGAGEAQGRRVRAGWQAALSRE